MICVSLSKIHKRIIELDTVITDTTNHATASRQSESRNEYRNLSLTSIMAFDDMH